MNANKLRIKIRPMLKSDINDVVAVEEESYGKHHWSRESFFNELSNDLAHYFCAINEEGKLIGYIGTWQIIEEAHITNISVKPDFRRNKIGEALLHVAIENCYKNGIKYITLEVRVSNEKAINLYSKYGFKSLGTRKEYYQDNNEDALIMWTENIFYDKFKTLYNENIEKLKKVISIDE
ncbi:ribosomal protein S18-alanine N-acetyltransferase [bacterium]|nr:ribosomal protein S18-alanine N-acetyltransferase [bacterium]